MKQIAGEGGIAGDSKMGVPRKADEIEMVTIAPIHMPTRLPIPRHCSSICLPVWGTSTTVVLC